MINIQEINDALSELHNRTGIAIEIYDSEHNAIVGAGAKKPLLKNKNASSIVTRTNKNYTIYALAKDGSPIDDSVLQLISINLEHYFSSRGFSDIFRDRIYGKISNDVFSQLLSASGIKTNLTYRLYLIRCNGHNTSDVMYVAEEIIDQSSGDMLFCLNEDNIILIKECSSESTSEEADDLSHALIQSISFEFPKDDISISVSRSFDSLCNADSAYAAASDTLRVGSVCVQNKNVYIEEKLRLELFLDMLPETLLRDFLASHSGQTISEAWDDKLIETVQSLFDNDLNLSVTARDLYTHRNTLVYRLIKIKKISGYDLNKFDDAVMFKILMTADKLINSSGK